jgi:fatty-acyl-CoA synthase
MPLLRELISDLTASLGVSGELGVVDRVRSDLRYAQVAARFGRLMLSLRARGLATLSDIVARQAERAPDHEAVCFGDQSLCYADLDGRANQFAHWARSAGVARGDVVAVLMRNEPDFLAAWLGLAKIGAVTALLNTNLVEKPLAHALDVVRPAHVIVGAGLTEAYASARRHRSGKAVAWYQEALPRGARCLADALATAATSPPDAAGAAGSDDNRMCFIYTSGTTGLPKAAIVSHLRVVGGAVGAAAALDISPRDRTYVALPLYHASGAILAAGGAFVGGGTVILAAKFSASRFWPDCIEHGATLFQYIGELCRFLVNQPPSQLEKRHSIRACMGNGLRAEVWREMERRFRIPQVVEFYGATEGNVGLFNLDNRIGAIGRVPPALQRAIGLRLLKFDVARGELVRDRDGRYLEAGVGEPGEAVGRIGSVGGFDGYSDRKASAAKVLRDVFVPGDRYFRTGDLLRCDADGYFYFVDRIGDTFRWRGENVATGEVAEIVAQYAGVRDVCVYGVEVPGMEGRAGMAAITCDDPVDGTALARHVRAHLPAYARPLFVRILPAIATTGTFKHQRNELAKQGFDPRVVKDPLFFLDHAGAAYRTLDGKAYNDIRSGRWRP